MKLIRRAFKQTAQDDTVLPLDEGETDCFASSANTTLDTVHTFQNNHTVPIEAFHNIILAINHNNVIHLTH